MPFSEKQQEFFNNCSHRWNFKVGATQLDLVKLMAITFGFQKEYETELINQVCQLYWESVRVRLKETYSNR